MFAFVVYAIGVWYAAARWRRRWKAFAWVAAGFAGLVLVAYLHYCLNIWSHGTIYLPVLRSLLYPYTALVVVVGVFIACLPVRRGKIGCPTCDYDLGGLEEEASTCPECGTPFMIHEGRAVRVYAELLPAPGPATPAVTPAKGARQRRRPGPPPVVLRWPPA